MSILVILDRLLEQASTTESQEHVLEQAHYASENVEQRLLTKFDQLVGEISDSLGNPEFNASTEKQDGCGQSPMPAWVMGGKAAIDRSTKIMRLSYWRRDTGVSYLLLRQELDSKDRPKYYDVVLGGRRRTRTNTREIKSLRHSDTSFLGWVKRMLSFKKQS
jgi:hypothetical protein